MTFEVVRLQYGDDTAKGSGIGVCSVDYILRKAWKKFFAFILGGSHGTFVL